MKPSLIKIENLSTGFRSKRETNKLLHKNLNLQINSSELICILGPNGAGKSTLLKTLLGFELPLEGKVVFNNTNLDQVSVREMAKLVSVVLTDKIDDLYLTAREIIATGRYPYGSFTGKLSEDDLTKIESAEGKVGIGQLSNHKFTTLSDGEKQKVMIARAIVQATPFIFLDEPVAFIDAPSKIGIMQLLHQLVHEMGKGILMATHDIDSALNYADKIWLLGIDGSWETGTPDDLLESGKINYYFDRENIKFDKNNRRFIWTEK